jgi:hypothetical protein
MMPFLNVKTLWRKFLFFYSIFLNINFFQIKRKDNERKDN